MSIQRILAVLPSWVGDVVMATPALRALRRCHPAAHIAYLLRPGLADLLDGLDWFDETIAWPAARDGLFAAPRLLRHLRSAPADLCVLFPNSFRAALAARLGGAKRRIGYDRDARGWLLTDRLAPQRNGRGFRPLPMLDYYRALAHAAGCTEIDNRLELRATPRDEAALDARLGKPDPRPILLLNPGASYGQAKCWPADRYAALADSFAQRHDLRVIVTCGPNERAVADGVRAAAKHPLTVFVDPPLGLGPLKALVRRARLMVTNDTGPRHFAAAFGTPVVTIFGSSDPAWTETWHPLERKVMESLDCQPCMKRACPLGHHNCMKQLSVEKVAAACEELLASNGPKAEPNPGHSAFKSEIRNPKSAIPPDSALTIHDPALPPC